MWSTVVYNCKMNVEQGTKTQNNNCLFEGTWNMLWEWQIPIHQETSLCDPLWYMIVRWMWDKKPEPGTTMAYLPAGFPWC